MKYTFKTTKSGINLLELLTDNLPGITLNNLKKQLSLKEIKINGNRVKQNQILNSGDKVEIFLPQILSRNLDITSVYEDDNIIVVDKPILMDTEVQLLGLLKEKYPVIFPVHRLDRNTTGLVVFAKNPESFELLSEAFKQRLIGKYYWANVYGLVKPDKKILQAYLKKDSENKMSIISDKNEADFSPIITEYKVIKYGNENTELIIKLVTGKMHQIRAHLSFIGHFVIGDGKYGKNEINEKFKQKFQQLRAEAIVFNGLEKKLSYLNGLEVLIKNSHFNISDFT